MHRKPNERQPRQSVSIIRQSMSALLSVVFAFFALCTAGASVECAADPIVPIPRGSDEKMVYETSKGCLDCHVQTEAMSMHKNPAVKIGCAECHGGNSAVRAVNFKPGTGDYDAAKLAAHIQPANKEIWTSSRNPVRGYAAALKESAEFIKFVNPGDFRVAAETCGGCHTNIVDANKRSLMTTAAMFWQGAAYNNGILESKIPLFGEAYNRAGEPVEVQYDKKTWAEKKRPWALQRLIPLPQWESLAPGDVFRIFERGGLFVKTQFPDIGFPNAFEDPGKPDVRQSNRGPGTGSRISVPVLNIHKTRLNDPHLSLFGTNDHPGDFRSSGCTGCHVVYANDRDPRHSGPYAKYGHAGLSQTKDPTIPKNEEGHPIGHAFTRAIPTSQCMVCHMHQPNMFVNSYLGYTMWDYETDADKMWPKDQKYPSIKEYYNSLDANPEEAAIRGNWTDEMFLRKVSELNDGLKQTQFADYHGHGWNFRAVYKRDRKGNLLDESGKVVPDNDPKKFKKAVHLADIHLDKGMHCVDCHFGQDSHGDGNIVGEVAQSVEISCEDCHGTVKEKARVRTSGPAAPTGGKDLSLARTAFGDARFVWREGQLYQRSNLDEKLEWRVKQVRDSVDPASGDFNPESAKAKMTKRLGDGDTKAVYASLAQLDGASDKDKLLAHPDSEMSCFTCHSAWVTSCAGCHLPIQANWKRDSAHYDGKTTRNWASYNPQVARDDMFQIGRHGPAKNGKIVPVRSSSALVLSSTDINRQRIYVQQPPQSSSGFSSQAFGAHFPHTVRTKETKRCNDCHVSESNDNNAIMAQLLLQGTNFTNFLGFHAYVATGEGGFEAIQVTEWDEPQAVIGSYLHRFAYPDFFKKHLDNGKELETIHEHHGAGGVTNSIQVVGEFLFTAAGEGGFRVYDVANVGNKGFSERMVTSPVSPLGQDMHVPTEDATGLALPTTMPMAPHRPVAPENLEQKLHPLYKYAYVSDRVEGLVGIDITTLADGEPRNNFLERSVTWNENGVLNGASTITLAGAVAFVGTTDKLALVDLDKPTAPRLLSSIPFNGVTSVQIQFRYAFVTDKDGFHVVDITHVDKPRRIELASIKLADARKVYLARTFAYVAGGKDGLVIVDIEKPEAPRIAQYFNDGGEINDLTDVKVASTNASLFAYLADGVNGLKVVQLTDPDRVPGFYGFSPEVKPELIAWSKTEGPALAISKPLDRDRAVDETGHQVSVFGRIGSRPFTKPEMESLYLNKRGMLYTVP